MAAPMVFCIPALGGVHYLGVFQDTKKKVGADTVDFSSAKIVSGGPVVIGVTILPTSSSA